MTSSVGKDGNQDFGLWDRLPQVPYVSREIHTRWCHCTAFTTFRYNCRSPHL